ncbi:MAG: hypothetical protein RR048_07770, partial [Oscillospiraceae bacterium]
MDTKKIIGPLQMASLCVLVRMFALFAFSPAVNQIENGNTRFLGNVVGFLVSAAMWIPAYYIFKGKTDYNILDYGKSVSPNVGKITSVILYFATVSIAIVTVSQFDYFITTTIYPNSSKLLYVIILIGTGMYYTSKGLEPIGRVANIFFALFIISLFLILGMLAPKINLVSLSTPFYD